MNNIVKLLSIASSPLANGSVEGEASSDLVQQHLSMLARRNGFLAFESALLVRPIGGSLDVFEWNRADGWRQGYGQAADGLFFFAEDVFGGQFAIVEDQIVSFDPETGDREPIADSLDEWAKLVLTDGNVVTGYPLAHEWQQTRGTLSLGERLMPRVPFIANGDFAVENLLLVSDQVRMERGGLLATAVRNVADGESLRMPYAV